MSRLNRSIFVLAMVCWPSLSVACSVCFDATAENNTAFLNATIFMSLFPLAIIGGGCWWVYQQIKATHGPSIS